MLWRESWTVRVFCILIILATLGTSGSARVSSTHDALILRPSVTGVLDTLQACWSVRSSVSFSLSYSEDSSSDTVSSTSNGALLGGDTMGAVAASLSLLTNFVATKLIVYRTWCVTASLWRRWSMKMTDALRREHRHIVMWYLQESSPRTQVERTLGLLVESGLLYCAFWVRPLSDRSAMFPTVCSCQREGRSVRRTNMLVQGLIVIYEWSYTSAYKYGFYHVIRGSLVPLIVSVYMYDGTSLRLRAGRAVGPHILTTTLACLGHVPNPRDHHLRDRQVGQRQTG